MATQPASKSPTIAQSLEYFLKKLSEPRVEFLVRAEMAGAVSEADRKLEIAHLANIEAVIRTYENFVGGKL